ncbi:MAG: hypothetical protein ACREN2_10470 [Candidatus Dormibacteria bacterium]
MSVIAEIDDLGGRIEAACVGALAGEAAAGAAAGAADLLGVAESVSACGCFDEADLRQRGLARPSRGGSSGLLLRAVPFGLLTPLQRPRLRRDAYRCVALAGADEGTAVAAVAAALLAADLLRFDLATALIRVRQSLLEDAPMALLDQLRVGGGPEAEIAPNGNGNGNGDAVAVLRAAIAAVASAETVAAAIAASSGHSPVAQSLAGALVGAHQGRASIAGVEAEHLPHGDRALHIAHRLAEQAQRELGESRPGESTI